MPATPMMQQYFEIKNQYKDYILFYRLGDFYEMFYDDAKLASRELELTLTGRDCGEDERAPMCGVPFHSAEGYVGRLVSKGYKVAICEQMEDPALAKGIVKREVIRVITPGTLIETSLLDDSRNNYICALCVSENEAGVCFADISTGQISATVFSGKNNLKRVLNELATYQPREAIINVARSDIMQIVEYLTKQGTVINDGEEERFDPALTQKRVTEQFASAKIEVTNENLPAMLATGALLGYITETQKTDISYIKEINVYSDGQFLEIDANTRRNLEISETMRAKEKKGSLLWVLDKTRTSPGARLLRKWVDMPLVNTYYIARRQRAVSELYNSFMLREELSDLLKNVLDLERLITKVVYATANAKDLKAIAATAAVIPQIKALFADLESDELTAIGQELDSLDNIQELINRAIADDPPFSVRDGGLIKPGYSAEADELRSIINDGKCWVEAAEASERGKTGIKNLKIGYNKVFGYYIEVTRSNITDVPDTYIRKQTLSNCERYITQELKDMEAKILGASDKITALEYELFSAVRDKVAAASKRVQDSAAKLALADVYLSLADCAVKNGYTCPEVEYGDVIEIKEGRHPVVELFARDSYFVPNDTCLDTGANRLMLITGPNMAGKSTYMRQVALITLMAQIGSFVPAKEARISVVDKVFTRVGASDDLASGHSTFMLEMTEVAYILKNATKRSLIIYDEIGRGTSTFDGMSIARAVAEYTAGRKLGAKTLFATHYHELTDLEAQLPGVVNYNIAAKKKGDDITFLRKIIRGAADDSYGIEVAKLAGVPAEIIKRAKEVLKKLEEGENISKPAFAAKQPPKDDLNISFDDYKMSEVKTKIKSVDLNIITPIEAMNFIFDLKKIIE